MTKVDLENQMWITYKARFNAHKRLLTTNTFYTVIVSSVSVFILCLNILQLMPSLVNLNQSAVTFYTISLSIIILVISLIFSFSDNKYNASKFHECALEIKEIYNTFSLNTAEASQREIEKYNRMYCDCLRKYDLNHSYLDNKMVEVLKAQKISFSIPLFWIWYFVRYYSILFLLLIIPIIVGFIVIFI
jgi:hypothetical protein